MCVFLSSSDVVLIRRRQTLSQEAFMSLTNSLNERLILLDFEILPQQNPTTSLSKATLLAFEFSFNCTPKFVLLACTVQ